MMSIQETLRLFGITRCYKGFLHTAYAIQLAVENENRLEAVTKEIYMETAFHFNCTWTAVERNIRTAVARAWKINHALLCDMAGYPLTCAPPPLNLLRLSPLTYFVHLSHSYRCGLLSCFNYFTSFLSLFHFLLLTFYSWSFRLWSYVG